MSAIFISHSSRDDPVAGEIRDWLDGQGHRSVFLDFDPGDGIPAGRDWEQELYREIRACRAVIVLCSQHSMASRWCFMEITHARALGKHLFPVRIDDCDVDGVLADRQVIDLTGDRQEALVRLGRGILASGLDPVNAFDWDGSRSPYPGLLAFQEQDAAIFFGRDDEVGEGLDLVNRVRRLGHTRLVTVLGASGTGKSSLVRAGLLPRLRRDVERWLVVDPLRPRDDPARQLAAVLSRAFDDPQWSRQGIEQEIRAATSQAEEGEAPADVLEELARSLLERSRRGEARVLLPIDQFEELLGHPQDHPASRFLRLLRASLDEPGNPLLVLATLRSDFLGSFQSSPALSGLRYESLSLGPMSAGDVAQVIEKPAQLAAIDLEPGLVQAMVTDAETGDALPLLAFTLRQLNERYGEDKLLEIHEYRQGLGGLHGAVAKAADEILEAERLDAAQEAQLRTAVLSLVRITEDGTFARRTATWDQLPEAAHPLLEKFVRGRLLVAGSDGERRTLEVAHEALFHSWGQLVRWLEESAEALRLRHEIEVASRSWQERGRAGEDLWRGGRLARARELIEERTLSLEESGREFVEASQDAEQAQIQAEVARRRKVLQGSLAAAAVAILLALAAVYSAARAQRSAAQARAGALLIAAEAHADPLVRTLLLAEMTDSFEPLRGLHTAVRAVQETLPLAVLRGHEDDVSSVAFSPSGEHIATGSGDGTARIWKTDGSDRDDPVVLQGHDGDVVSVAFSPSGDRIVTGSRDDTARI